MNRKILRLLVVITVFGAVYAAAASLGGINSGRLGADDATVASCDTDGVSTSYTSGWDASDRRYEVSAVNVSGIDNSCDGESMSVTLTDGSGSIGAGTLTIPTDAASTSATVTLGTQPAASAVTGVHVSIS